MNITPNIFRQCKKRGNNEQRPSRQLMKRLFFLLIALFISSQAAGAEFFAPARVSQGHAFPVSVTGSAPFNASFTWRGETFSVSAVRFSPALWKAEALFAMPIDAYGKHTLRIQAEGENKKFSIIAVPVPWQKSILKVAPKYVEPPKNVQEKIAADAAKSKKALAVRTEKSWTLPLHRPVPGGITSPFGGRRVFNGKARAPHKGTDMRCAEGTKVEAAADGVVLLAENQYFGGNMVYIDHGQGVVSTYAHLSAFNAAEGDVVKKGQIIGFSGSTGRVTGPHLHFGLLIQGVAVDAMPLLKETPQIVGGPSRSIFDTPQKPKHAKKTPAIKEER